MEIPHQTGGWPIILSARGKTERGDAACQKAENLFKGASHKSCHNFIVNANAGFCLINAKLLKTLHRKWKKIMYNQQKQMETGKGFNVLDDADSCCGCSCSSRCRHGSPVARSRVRRLPRPV
jgi:hypothetical protein